VELSDDARDLVNASDLNTILRIKEYRVKYDTLMMDPNFRKALAEARGVAVKDLPTYFYSFN
jgi:hypothetical protein